MHTDFILPVLFFIGEGRPLRDGLYNIRGHIVEIRDGKRVTSASGNKSTSHTASSWAAHKSMLDHTAKTDTPVFTDRESATRTDQSSLQRVVYSGNSYLKQHVNDLLGESDAFITTMTPNENLTQGVLQDINNKSEKKPPIAARINGETIVSSNSRTASNDVVTIKSKEMTKESSSDQDHRTVNASISSIDSLEDTEGGDENVPDKKSNLKNGNSTNKIYVGDSTRQRRVTFSDSIEFNDGIVWPLIDNEPRSGQKHGISNAFTSSSTYSVKRTTLGGTEKYKPNRTDAVGSSSSSGATNPKRFGTVTSPQNGDFSYPESVDLSVPVSSKIAVVAPMASKVSKPGQKEGLCESANQTFDKKIKETFKNDSVFSNSRSSSTSAFTQDSLQPSVDYDSLEEDGSEGKGHYVLNSNCHTRKRNQGITKNANENANENERDYQLALTGKAKSTNSRVSFDGATVAHIMNYDRLLNSDTEYIDAPDSLGADELMYPIQPTDEHGNISAVYSRVNEMTQGLSDGHTMTPCSNPMLIPRERAITQTSGQSSLDSFSRVGDMSRHHPSATFRNASVIKSAGVTQNSTLSSNRTSVSSYSVAYQGTESTSHNLVGNINTRHYDVSTNQIDEETYSTNSANFRQVASLKKDSSINHVTHEIHTPYTLHHSSTNMPTSTADGSTSVLNDHSNPAVISTKTLLDQSPQNVQSQPDPYQSSMKGDKFTETTPVQTSTVPSNAVVKNEYTPSRMITSNAVLGGNSVFGPLTKTITDTYANPLTSNASIAPSTYQLNLGIASYAQSTHRNYGYGTVGSIRFVEPPGATYDSQQAVRSFYNVPPPTSKSISSELDTTTDSYYASQPAASKKNQNQSETGVKHSYIQHLASGIKSQFLEDGSYSNNRQHRSNYQDSTSDNDVDAESEEDNIINDVKKSMAELQLNTDWTPKFNFEQTNVRDDNSVKNYRSRPSNNLTKGNKLDSANDGHGEGSVKQQNKIDEAIQNGSNIPIRMHSRWDTSPKRFQVKNAESKDNDSQQTFKGLVPHPPLGPRKKIIPRGSGNKISGSRSVPMKAMKQKVQSTSPSGQESNVKDHSLKSKNKSKSRTTNGKNSHDKNNSIVPRSPSPSKRSPVVTSQTRTTYARHQAAEEEQRNTSDLRLQTKFPHQTHGPVYDAEVAPAPNEAFYIPLNKTPTDDEINELWKNVRNCLTASVTDRASSDSVYVRSAPWKQRQGMQNGTGAGQFGQLRGSMAARRGHPSSAPIRRSVAGNTLPFRRYVF